MRRQALDRKRPGDADAGIVGVRLVVEIFDIGTRGDAGVDLALTGDPRLPPFGVRFGGYAAGLPVAEMLIGRGLAVLAGILVIVGGLAGIKGASRMPRLGARYSAPGAKRTARDPDTELWEALTDGEDPTAGR